MQKCKRFAGMALPEVAGFAVPGGSGSTADPVPGEAGFPVMVIPT